MNRIQTLSRLRACEADLRTLGIARLSLSGSIARGKAGPRSDVDLAAIVAPDRLRHEYDQGVPATAWIAVTDDLLSLGAAAIKALQD